MNKKPENSKRNSEIKTIDPVRPDQQVIEQAADIVTNGGIVIFPTRTLYGMGVDAFNENAVSRVFCFKQRAVDKPLSVLVSTVDAVAGLAADIPDAAVRLMRNFWPGRLTIVFSARPDVPGGLTAGTGKIGIRVPEHPVATALVAALDCPLTATSANLSGDPGADCIDNLPPEIINNVDLVLDSGKLKGGLGSTVVDVSTDPPTVLREGEVSKNDLFSVLGP